jgi:hypothetical protein
LSTGIVIFGASLQKGLDADLIGIDELDMGRQWQMTIYWRVKTNAMVADFRENILKNPNV